MPRAAAGPSGDPVTEIVDALAPLAARHRMTWARRCQAHGLSIVGFEVLALLEVHGPMPMTRLAAELDVALPNATGIVDRMARRGIVARSNDEADRRVVRVGLTDVGRGLVADIEAERRERTARLIGMLERDQQQRLLQVIDDLRSASARLATTEETSS